ncbi:MAG: hypothetical protein Kow0031_07570 [Anaerolineae bacterium]
MANLKYHLRSTALSAAAYGAGFTVGALFSSLAYRSSLFDPLLRSVDTGRLVIGIIVILLIAGLGGALGGGLGGASLAYAYRRPEQWQGYAWRSALAFGLSFALIAVPLTIAIAFFSFYNLTEISPLALMFPLGVMGLAFGLVGGLIVGLLNEDIPTWRVVLVAMFSFGLGGAALGRGLFTFYLAQSNLESASWSLFFGLFLFGAFGGGALGFLYSWLAHRRPAPSLPSRFVAWFNRQRGLGRGLAVVGIVLLLLVLRGLYLISPFTASDAPLSEALESRTQDTRWAEPAPLVASAAEPVVAAASAQQVALAWVADGAVYYLPGADQLQPLNVSGSGVAARQPQVAVDAAGTVHLLWEQGSADGASIFYSRCQPGNCSPPAPVSGPVGPACRAEAGAQASQPALAVTPSGDVLAVWLGGPQTLLFAAWPAGDAPAGIAAGCVPLPSAGAGQQVQSPRLSAGVDGSFGLVFVSQSAGGDGDIFSSSFSGGNWSNPQPLGEGIQPEIYVDVIGQRHYGWCNLAGQVWYRQPDSPTELVAAGGCEGRPSISVGGAGAPRLVWYSNQVQNVARLINPAHLLLQSVRAGEGWREPSIVARPGGPVQASLAADNSGTLHLAYVESGGPAPLLYTHHTDYTCPQPPSSPVGQQVLNLARAENYTPDNIVPYCNNRFDHFLYAPNPLPAFSNIPPTPNGAFDVVAEELAMARYEVGFATMWYQAFKEVDSPGRVLARGVTELYHKVKANPEQYPRGMTVRLLLGNPPSFAFFPSFKNQVWTLYDDLQAAGLPELRNDDIGWKVEVANYSGSWPHSHTKTLIVDGAVVQSAGFNMQYSHLPVDHPSGSGGGRVDMGMQIAGPVAQSALRAFDELWHASDVVDCGPVDPGSILSRVRHCSAYPGHADHVPEVLQYFVPDDGDVDAFRVFRTFKFLEGDDLHATALASARQSIDVMHVNFSLETVCALNILVEACTYANRVEYMGPLMEAAENGARLRILILGMAWVGVENRIAVSAFMDELEARGLSDQVEIRFFDGDMHVKAALIDDEFLLVGSQNFHYSAWGNRGSLAEFNVGTDDPAAVAEFKKYYDYYWEKATPWQP